MEVPTTRTFGEVPVADFIRSDLEFVLQQIKIAEHHTAGGGQLDDLVGNDVDSNGNPLQVSSPVLPFGLRTVSGIYNNISSAARVNWGAADQDFLELVPHQFLPNYVPTAPDPDGPAGPLTPGSVIDPEPREISNLVVDQTINNPSAVEAALGYYEVAAAEADAIRGLSDALQQAKVTGIGEQAAFDALLARMESNDVVFAVNTNAIGEQIEGVLVLPNVAPDEGLSAPFNSWFTFFGQFFDHGLDLVNKENNGSVVFIALAEDDPRFNPLTPQPELHGAVAVGKGRRRQLAQRHQPVRRPEPDLQLASLAPGLPARIRDRGRRAGPDRPADRGRQRRHGHLGRRQGAGRDNARHPAH